MSNDEEEQRGRKVTFEGNPLAAMQEDAASSQPGINPSPLRPKGALLQPSTSCPSLRASLGSPRFTFVLGSPPSSPHLIGSTSTSTSTSTSPCLSAAGSAEVALSKSIDTVVLHHRALTLPTVASPLRSMSQNDLRRKEELNWEDLEASILTGSSGTRSGSFTLPRHLNRVTDGIEPSFARSSRHDRRVPAPASPLANDVRLEEGFDDFESSLRNATRLTRSRWEELFQKYAKERERQECERRASLMALKARVEAKKEEAAAIAPHNNTEEATVATSATRTKPKLLLNFGGGPDGMLEAAPHGSGIVYNSQRSRIHQPNGQKSSLLASFPASTLGVDGNTRTRSNSFQEEEEKANKGS